MKFSEEDIGKRYTVGNATFEVVSDMKGGAKSVRVVTSSKYHNDKMNKIYQINALEQDADWKRLEEREKLRQNKNILPSGLISIKCNL